ncbi:MAG: hypothetical protein JXR58_09620 [Bacteroidales bacterium]|nr:hypothetical protein [Bacteroidales bacterium]
MKAQKSKINLLILLLVFSSISLFSQKQEFTKKIEKEFPANQNTLLNITNKFGDIVFVDWDNSKIQIVVNITVSEKNEEKGQEKLNEIDVLFSTSGDEIIAKTEIKNNKSGFFKNTDNSNYKLSIDYEVKLPRYTKLKIDNRYGDVTINEHNGKSDFVVKFGSFTARNLPFDESKPLSKIDVSYGKLNITKLTWADIDVSFSDANIDAFNGLELISKYTDVKIGNGSILKGKIQFGELVTGNIGTLELNSSYSDVKIGKLEKTLNLVASFGNVKILSLSKNFGGITIDSKYTDIKIIVDPAASFTAIANLKFGDVKFPSDFNVQKVESATSVEVNSKIGNNPQPIIKVNGSFGDLKFEY